MNIIFTLIPLILTFQLSAMPIPEKLQIIYNDQCNNTVLSEYLADFPHSKYKIYEVKNLGKFYIDNIPDGIKSHLRRGIYWEEGIGNFVRKYSQPGTIAIDVGAHIGIHTITMSRKVGQNGLVISFEPQHKIFREHRYNLALNSCTHNVVPLNLACGDTICEKQLSVRDPINEGGTAIGTGGDICQMITLDSLKLENVSFIKADIECFEYKFLLGARETIARCRPVIVLEIQAGVDFTSPEGLKNEEYIKIKSFFEDNFYELTLIFGNDFIAMPL